MATEKYKEDSPGQPTPGENDPKEAMDKPGDVEESNDANIDEDFPGFPHHPANTDDIADPDNTSAA